MNRPAILLCVLCAVFVGCSSPRSVAPPSAPPVPAAVATARLSGVAPSQPPQPQNVTISVLPPHVFTLVESADLAGWSFATNSDASGQVTVPKRQSMRFYRGFVTNLVEVAWDSSPDPLVTGYKVYAGRAGGAYDQVVMTATNSLTMVGRAGTNYFSCVSFRADGSESDFSPEVTLVEPQFTLQIKQTP